MDEDRRSFRVALVADRYVNPPKDGLDAMPVLREHDWGIIQLPAAGYPADVAEPLLEQVAEQTEEFHRHGYDVVIIGDRAGLAKALASVGLHQLERIDPATVAELTSFLRERQSTPRKA